MKDGVTVKIDNLKMLLDNIHAMVGERVYVGIPHDKDKRNQQKDDQKKEKKKRAKKGEEKQITVGNVQIAYINEYGSAGKRIPARPFLMPGIRKVTPQILGVLQAGARAGLTKRGAVHRSLRISGRIAVASVRKTMTAGEGYVPLSQRTLDARRAKKRKSTKPLIETGRLRRSITYVIRKRKWRG